MTKRIKLLSSFPFVNWQYHMERYAKMIVKMLKAEKLYASQGGPIILSQVSSS
jgi:hypothetical protein